MRPKLKELFARAESWPDAVQDAAIETLSQIEEELERVYQISDDEWAAIQDGIAQADRGDLAPEETVLRADMRRSR